MPELVAPSVPVGLLTSCLHAAQVWEAQRENGRGGHDHPAGHESLGGLEFWTRYRSV